MKAFLKRLLPNRIKPTHAQRAVERYKAEESSRIQRCGPVKCCDCLKEGYFSMIEFGEYELTDGWKLVWVGLKPLVICGECQGKRRKLAKEFLTGEKYESLHKQGG